VVGCAQFNSDLAPASPAAFEFRDARPSEIDPRDREDLAKFGAALGRVYVAQELETPGQAGGVSSLPESPAGDGISVAAGPSRIRRLLQLVLNRRVIFAKGSGPLKQAAMTAKQAANTILVDTRSESPSAAWNE